MLLLNYLIYYNFLLSLAPLTCRWVDWLAALQRISPRTISIVCVYETFTRLRCIMVEEVEKLLNAYRHTLFLSPQRFHPFVESSTATCRLSVLLRFFFRHHHRARLCSAASNSSSRKFHYTDFWIWWWLGFFFTEFRFSHWSKREEVRGNEKKKLIIPKSRRWTKSPLIVAAAAAASLKVFSIDQKLLFDFHSVCARIFSLSSIASRLCDWINKHPRPNHYDVLVYYLFHIINP